MVFCQDGSFGTLAMVGFAGFSFILGGIFGAVVGSIPYFVFRKLETNIKLLLGSNNDGAIPAVSMSPVHRKDNVEQDDCRISGEDVADLVRIKS